MCISPFLDIFWLHLASSSKPYDLYGLSLNIMTTLNLTITSTMDKINAHITSEFPLNWTIVSIIKRDVMAELLFWIALNCIGVPNKVLDECSFTGLFWRLLLTVKRQSHSGDYFRLLYVELSQNKLFMVVIHIILRLMPTPPWVRPISSGLWN